MMERIYQYIKETIVNFKVNSCCWIAPLRIGVYICGFYVLITSMMYLIATATDLFKPNVLTIQEAISEGNTSASLGILTYGTEMCSSVVLLCAIYRKDIPLLRLYVYYSLIQLAVSLIVYAVVIAVINFLVALLIIFNTLFQIYVLILVRSVIVEIRLELKEKETIELSNIAVTPRAEVETQTDAEVAVTTVAVTEAIIERHNVEDSESSTEN